MLVSNEFWSELTWFGKPWFVVNLVHLFTVVVRGYCSWYGEILYYKVNRKPPQVGGPAQFLPDGNRNSYSVTDKCYESTGIKSVTHTYALSEGTSRPQHEGDQTERKQHQLKLLFDLLLLHFSLPSPKCVSRPLPLLSWPPLCPHL